MAQQVAAAPTVTKPRPPSATQSPQCERSESGRDLVASPSVFQSVGHRSQGSLTNGSVHSKAEWDRSHGSLALYAGRASAHSSHPWIAPSTSPAAAQSAKQVLSEVLSDPPEVLSARR